jgi:exo-1,4-beta-D-glucosaminidase
VRPARLPCSVSARVQLSQRLNSNISLLAAKLGIRRIRLLRGWKSDFCLDNEYRTKVNANASREAMSVLRVPKLASTYLVRAVLMTATREVLAENVYWESTTDDDLGSAKNDEQFKTDLAKSADLSALNTMPRSDLEVSVQVSDSNGEEQVAITLTNPANRVAFFVRAEVTYGADGNEILPITYDDNYITVFPHEVRTIVPKFAGEPGKSAPGGLPPALRVEGYNVAKTVISLK